MCGAMTFWVYAFGARRDRSGLATIPGVLWLGGWLYTIAIASRRPPLGKLMNKYFNEKKNSNLKAA